ncbi:unnamed protein product [Caenorhabditis sp. 36 PRJEB53466]|nr:unnamed protein product [Caenorhabditis sp. 36 PRJEB53466]
MNSKTVLLAFLLAIISVCLAQKKEEIFARAVGPCIADKCQTAHTCFYGQCIPDGIAPPMKALNQADAIGPCLNSMCPGDNFCHQGHCYSSSLISV